MPNLRLTVEFHAHYMCMHSEKEIVRLYITALWKYAVRLSKHSMFLIKLKVRSITKKSAYGYIKS